MIDTLWLRNGKPIKRPEGSLPPCKMTQGCAKGTIDHPRTMHPIMEKNYRFYRRCKVLGRFPVDPWVEWYAGEFAAVEDEIERKATYG